MTDYELRNRDDEWPALFLAGRPGGLAEALSLAGKMYGWSDVYADGTYLVTSGWYWWPEAGGGMHQIGSHGWCHDCHSEGLGYVHHLAYETELAVLAHEARTDRFLRRQCEADGQTPEQYAASIAGRAVALDGDRSFVTCVHELGTGADGLAVFAVDMWDMTTWKVAVPVAEGAPRTAQDLAERLAYEATPKRCHDCHGTAGHARDCDTVRLAGLLARYGG